ncbi:MAG: oxidoreductase [Opitutaceae bacterium]|nr:oxidoreductase [Opitutaceae bacterium]
MNTNQQNSSRRTFLKAGAAVSTLAALGTQSKVFASNPGASDKLKVGLIGCGGRGTAALHQCVSAAPNIEVHALADFFPDKIEVAKTKFTEGWGSFESIADKLKIEAEHEFAGFNAYKNLLKTDIDVVVIATQPGFRPIHYEAAINAGKHVFMEKPVAVDPPGVRKVIAMSKLAKEKGLSVVAGTQRRHAPSYIETLDRIHNGEIGELRGGDCYWNWGRKIGQNAQNPSWSEMEFQIRNWYFHCWGSGDCLVEQAIHQIDVMNWAFGGPPVSALGMGGLEIEHNFGNIYDHFAIMYEYPNGARVLAMASQIPGSTERIGQNIVGAKGTSDGQSLSGKKNWKYTGPVVNELEQEHRDFIASIRGDGPYLNHGKRIAESTLTAIIGRMSAYTGRMIRFDWALNKSQLDLTPAKWEIGPNPITPRPIPGQEQLV